MQQNKCLVAEKSCSVFPNIFQQYNSMNFFSTKDNNEIMDTSKQITHFRWKIMNNDVRVPTWKREWSTSIFGQLGSNQGWGEAVQRGPPQWWCQWPPRKRWHVHRLRKVVPLTAALGLKPSFSVAPKANKKVPSDKAFFHKNYPRFGISIPRFSYRSSFFPQDVWEPRAIQVSKRGIDSFARLKKFPTAKKCSTLSHRQVSIKRK